MAFIRSHLRIESFQKSSQQTALMSARENSKPPIAGLLKFLVCCALSIDSVPMLRPR